MDFNLIQSFSSGNTVKFVEKRSLLSGRVVHTFELAKPSKFNFLNSITKIVSAIFYRQRNEVLDLSKDDSRSREFLNLLSDDFKKHSSDVNWIKQIIPTIVTLEKIHGKEPLSDCIHNLNTVLDDYLREHPISESSSELIKSDRRLIMRAIKNQPDAIKYADDQIKNDPEFIRAAFFENNNSIKYAPIETILTVIKVTPNILNLLKEEKLIELINAGAVDLVASQPFIMLKPKVAEACLEKKPSLYKEFPLNLKMDPKYMQMYFQTLFNSSKLTPERQEQICERAALYVDNFLDFDKFSAFVVDLAKLDESQSLKDHIKTKYPQLPSTILSDGYPKSGRGRRSWP